MGRLIEDIGQEIAQLKARNAEIQKKIGPALRERDRNNELLAYLQGYIDKVSMGNGDQASAQAPETVDLAGLGPTEAASRVLAGGRHLKPGAIYDELVRRGGEVRGKRPRSNLTSILTVSRRFAKDSGGCYYLVKGKTETPATS
jgi:hypothetical protein